MMMTRLTTIARTGRLTNRSVNFMPTPHRDCLALGRLNLVRLFLALIRFGIRIVAGLHAVVDLNGGAVPEPEDSRADNLVAGIDSRGDRNLIASAALDLYYLLFHSPICVAFGIFHLGYHIDGVAVRCVINRSCWQRDYIARLARGQLDLYVHSGAEL